MRVNKIIRYIGLLFLLLSFVVILFMFTYSHQGIGLAATTAGDANHVLLVTHGEALPEMELRFVLQRMGISYDRLSLENTADTSGNSSKIKEKIETSASSKVIVIATEDAAYASIVSASQSEKTAGILLVSPQISSSEDLSVFGTNVPSVPVGILSPDDAYVRSLYERISGEDARLFPGIPGRSILPQETFVAPNGQRYLSVWNNISLDSVTATVFPFLPGVMEDAAGYIGTYILRDAEAADVGRNAAFTVRAGVMTSIVLLISGLGFFLASIPLSNRKKESFVAGGHVATVPNSPDKAVSSSPTDGMSDIFIDSSARARYKKKTLMVILITGAFFSLVSVMLFVFFRSLSLVPVLAWPIFYHALLSMYLPSKAARIPDRKIPQARFFMSTLVAICFFGTLMLLSLSFRQIPVAIPFLLRLIVSLTGAAVLGFFVQRSQVSGILFSLDAQQKMIFSSENRALTFILRASIFLPYMIILIPAALLGEMEIAISAVWLIISVATAIYVRYIFRTIGGTAKIAAFAYAMYLLIVTFL